MEPATRLAGARVESLAVWARVPGGRGGLDVQAPQIGLRQVLQRRGGGPAGEFGAGLAQILPGVAELAAQPLDLIGGGLRQGCSPPPQVSCCCWWWRSTGGAAPRSP